MKTVNLLVKLFDEELHSELKDVIVTCDQKGQYNLFGRYLVSPTKQNLFVAIDSHTKEVCHFISLKTAISWCTLCNSKKWLAARRLQNLDLKLGSLNTDIAVHRKMLKNATSPETKLIYLIKLQEDSLKRKQVLYEMNTFINSSKTIQEKNMAMIKDHKFKYQ